MKHISTDHMHFFVSDLDATIKFYEDLGFEFIHKLEHGGREAAQLRSESGLVIDLNKTRVSDNPGFSHFAMLVDDVEEACVNLKAKGYDVYGPVYSKDSKRNIISLRDPHGFMIQLVNTA
jgi:catechol 2,3-dioxygenase-like lactoylglutathione lyase family enzyme